MPEYEVVCLDCNRVWDQRHLMREPHAPCSCGSGNVRTHITGLNRVNLSPPLDSNWENLNGGLGQYFSQLEDSIDCKPSAKNYFRSRNDAIEACKRRGFTILEK